ncbi:acetylornithine transaminase [Candidatus Magnetominusculus xianensis]|uniref:Acetylornithine aminotransferase n=1 Tax=Candidatus Magnetominusculus xianensis TaxID=1748249 RepID=A0ABR5SL75_9BACT|nr:acetylornithine transaminase [Candidatus Magnetominusculus xianensis]KWT90510.1 acetylornithine aminotransferase [Candidatus Magnetominusculus xianensis]MBF0404164.1 acetylornithine transaminase [Nitrospirota bacterium]
MEVKKLLDESNQYIMDTYKRFPVVMVKGRGMKLWSADGKEYLDFMAGIAVNILGHCHPRHVVAIQKQAQKLVHVSNLYHNEFQIKLAKLLCDYSFADRVFFSNSGAEANEAAIKLARKHSKGRFGVEKIGIITALNSFHGRTLATLTATGQPKFHVGFEPLLQGFSYVPFNDYEALKSAIDENTCAVMLEPIQGEGGVKMATDNYFKHVRDLCTRLGILLIFDEIQTGTGRTGTLFAYEQYGIEPDILTLAKGLGGGVPIGATLAREEVAKAFTAGSHGSTFGGNPLACAAALETLETLLEDGIMLSECRRMGEYFMDSLLKLQKQFPKVITDVRGKGLLIGMELTRDCSMVVQACFERGVLINCTAGNTLRFMPPLIVTEEDIDRLVTVLKEIMERLS